jgi:hypothetical protein
MVTFSHYFAVKSLIAQFLPVFLCSLAIALRNTPPYCRSHPAQLPRHSHLGVTGLRARTARRNT